MQCRDELSAQKNCVLLGIRVVVPLTARADVLKLLHDAHPGIVHMKALARSYVWWPGMDGEVERVVRPCEACQLTHHNPPKAPLHQWEWTTKKWLRIHMDFAGPFQGKTFLVVVDTHSKLLAASIVPSMSSGTVINMLRSLFATHGIPDVLVSDNGAAFTSTEFEVFKCPSREDGANDKGCATENSYRGLADPFGQFFVRSTHYTELNNGEESRRNVDGSPADVCIGSLMTPLSSL